MPQKQFHQVLGDIRAGELNEELTAALGELVTAVQNTNKAGSLTLKIKLKPTKGLAFEIDDELSTNVPTLDKPSTILFPTVEGNLVPYNPMQKQLDLRTVQDGGTTSMTTVGMGQPAAVKEVGAPAAGTVKELPTTPPATGTEGQ